jgi:hypothetical protein
MVELHQIDERPVYTRSDLIRLRGKSLAFFEGLYRDRDSNGHPAPVGKVGRSWAWDATAWDKWYDTLTGPGRVDRSGNPDDLITLAEAARVLGMNPTSITRYPDRPPRGWPDPDQSEELAGGRVRRWYRRRKIWAYADNAGHTGGGRPAGPVVHRPYPYAGDPRLDVAREALAQTPASEHAQLPRSLAAEHQHFRTSAGTWSHILRSARQHPHH